MLKAAAADRNGPFIARVLAEYFKTGYKVLEIASGTGQHAVLLSQRFPDVIIQPSERDPRMIHSIVAHIDHFRLPNMRVPLFVDVTKPSETWALTADYGPDNVDVIFAANVVHISSTEAVEGLFRAGGVLLKKKSGLLIIYGPFSRNGVIEPESNVAFHRSLLQQDSDWGLRDTSYLSQLGAQHGLRLTAEHSMPANNYILVFTCDQA